MSHSPADVVRYLLIDQGVVSLPVNNAAWPCFVDFLPSAPDEAVSIHNTVGVMDGKLSRNADGEPEAIDHPGIQVMVRARESPSSYAKCKEIQLALDKVQPRTIVVAGDTTYTLSGVHRTGNIIPLGQEEKNRRELHALNAVLTMKEE